MTRYASGVAEGAAHRATEPLQRGERRYDDITLARKVETELFRPADAPKGSVSVNVQNGVVELRGEVKRPEDKKDLEAKARSIPEVRDVRNLLHLPKVPAPGRADSPGRQRSKSP